MSAGLSNTTTSQESAGPPPATAKPFAPQTEGAAENWFRRHLSALAIVLLTAGLVIRLVFASRSFLNPDEALLSLFSDQSSFFQVCRYSLGTAHPPLYLIVLYIWHLLGSSELLLRLPSVLAGVGLCWFLFKWTEAALSRAAGFAALTLAAFSPTLIGLAIEVRQYSLLLFFVSAALYFLEVAIRDSSPRKMLWFHLFSWAAILTHYSAIFFVLAAGLYALARIADAKMPRGLVASWIAGELGSGAIYAILYVVQVSKARAMIPIWAGYLNVYYFHGGFPDFFGFLREKTPQVFGYLFGDGFIAWLMLVIWIAVIAMLLLRVRTFPRAYSRTPLFALLLLLPFLALWAAVEVGQYPYIPGRHVAFLEPFAIAAVAALVAAIASQKLWRAFLIAAVLAALSSASGYSGDSFPITRDQRRELMAEAIRYVEQSVPRSDPILLDYQSSMVVAYYFCARSEVREFYASVAELIPMNCGGRSFTLLNYRSWTLNNKNFPAKFGALARQLGLRPGSQVWVIQSSWRANLDSELEKSFPQLRCLQSKRFGSEIVIIPFAVNSDLSAAPPIPCAN